jgi:hypothetical protein
MVISSVFTGNVLEKCLDKRGELLGFEILHHVSKNTLQIATMEVQQPHKDGIGHAAAGEISHECTKRGGEKSIGRKSLERIKESKDEFTPSNRNVISGDIYGHSDLGGTGFFLHSSSRSRLDGLGNRSR